jgi:lysosomal acid lipase/cholesteryl ester hydrolase
LQRIPFGRHGSIPSKKPVIVWHGLSTCSEMFVCSTPDDSLAFSLADRGYDVWLANARGSKYSQKHAHLSSSQNEYWKFSIDQYAQFDVPAVVDYVLEQTGASSVSYIGFSQGSAQIFAALSLSEELNYKINHVFALAPAMKPKQIKNKAIANIVTKYGPTVLYSILGKKAFMPIAEPLKTFNEHINSFLVKGAMKLLLSWKLEKFGSEQRELVLFRNVFSTT